jgi:hypothetical protein
MFLPNALMQGHQLIGVHMLNAIGSNFFHDVAVAIDKDDGLRNRIFPNPKSQFCDREKHGD